MVAIRNTFVELAVLVTSLATITLAWRHKHIVAGGLITIIGIIGVYNAGKFLPFSPANTWYPETPLAKFLQNQTPPFRVVGMEDGKLATDLATELRIYDPNYYDPLYIKQYGELVGYVNSGKVGGGLSRSDIILDLSASPSAAIVSRRERFMDMASVKYVYTQKPLTYQGHLVWSDSIWQVFVRNSAMPKVYLVDEVKAVGSDAQILSFLFANDFLPETQAIVSDPISGLTQLSSQTGLELKSAAIKSLTEQSMELTVESDRPRFLVITDTFYPGWKASVDGKETTIYRANYAFRGIVVPAGVHSVYLWYAPDSFTTGLWISIGSLAIWTGYMIAVGRRSR